MKTIEELVQEEMEKVELGRREQRVMFPSKVRKVLGDELFDSLHAQFVEQRTMMLFTYHGKQFAIFPYSAYSLLVKAEFGSLDDTSFSDAHAFLQFLAQF